MNEIHGNSFVGLGIAWVGLGFILVGLGIAWVGLW
jgi:hypothetical protein